MSSARRIPCVALVVSALVALSVAAAGPGLLPAGPGTHPPDVDPGGKATLPDGASSDWWSQVQRQIAEEEYALSPGGTGAPGAFGAFNRAQGFSATFDGRGLRLEPARGGEKSATWTWGLELVAWGDPAALEPVSRVAPSAEGARVEYLRGALSEWFLNDARGLEQGFTLPAPPAGSGVGSREPGPATPDSSRLTPHEIFLDLALSGNLHPRFSDDGQAVDFSDGGSVAVLRYAQLEVTDATGRRLPAHFEGFARSTAGGRKPTTGGGIRIVLDDTNAVYPITVDPLATSPSWASTGEEGQFGFSVATAGDVNGDGYSDVIVGADNYSTSPYPVGKAYLYLGGPSGLSTAASWSATGPSQGHFGGSVATAGDVDGDGYSDVVIGDYNGSAEGNAYLFLGGPSVLSATASWTATGEASGDRFGCSVAPAGDVNGDGYSDVLVGASRYGSDDAGKAYLFMGGPGGLSPTASWSALGDASGWCGSSVSTAGDVNGDGYADVLLGAPNGTSQRGKAYLYMGGPAGPSSTASWTVEGADLDMLGCSVATAGDVNGDGYSDVLVGAYGRATSTGRASLFLGGASGLSPSAEWTSDGGAAGEQYGFSVASSGDVNGDGYADVVVGAPNAGGGFGMAYLYFGGPSGPSTVPSWSAVGEASGSSFGSAVATAGDVNGDGYCELLVGAPVFNFHRGKAYLYLGGASGLSAGSWTAGGEAEDNYFGYAVATAGDVNGDGYAEALVGAQGYEGNRGKAYLYLGGPSGLSATSSWAVAGEAADDYFGIVVAPAGDVNGDGYADVLVGAPGNSGARGKACLYFGGPAGLQTLPAWTAAGEALNDEFGRGVTSAGDVNGDGYADVIVGAWGHSGQTGKVYLYLGGPSGLPATASSTLAGEAPGNHFGLTVATAGDVNGDGYSDVVIGANGYGGNVGKAYLYLGTPSGLSGSASWTAAGAGAGHSFGHCVAPAGDVNGDGYSDVLVGAPYGNSYRGSSHLFLGTPSGLSAVAAWTVAGEWDYDEFGISVATAGDVNGDGYSDVLVGADGYGSYSGKAYLYLGGPAGLPATASWSAVGEVPGDRLGLPVATAGDVNGDGTSDVIAGACWFGSKAGKAYLYYGNGGPGAPTRPRQLRSDLSALVSPGGLAYQQAFRLGLTLRSPVGVTTARIQYQIAPLGGTFKPWLNPIQTYGTSWNSVGPGSARTIPMTLPDQPAAYTWRARLRYSAVTSPFVPTSPWFTLAANGLRETDLRSTSAILPTPCVVPDEPCWLYSVVKSGTDYTLNFQDPNQSDQRTGWNIRRSNNPALPKNTWPLVGTNVVDMDASAANYQWTDHSGADPTPSLVWYYQVTTYNATCPAEGPF